MCHHGRVTDWIPPELLLPAFKAVRKALRDLDPDEVPAALRRVAGQSGRRLPPPLARKLIETLDENGWLREKAAEAGSDLDPTSSDPARAVSALFLQRPEAWEDRAKEVAEHRATGAQQVLVATLQRTIADLQQQLESARQKAKAAQQRAQGVEAEAERKSQAVRNAVEVARKEEHDAAEKHRRDYEALLERHRRLVQDLEEAGEEVVEGALRRQDGVLRPLEVEAGLREGFAKAPPAGLSADLGRLGSAPLWHDRLHAGQLVFESALPVASAGMNPKKR